MRNAVANETRDHWMHRKQQKVPCSPVENDYLRLASIRLIRGEKARLWREDELPIGIHFPLL